jgi:hypothetical protein
LKELIVKLGPRYDSPKEVTNQEGEWEMVASGNEYAVWSRPRKE